MLKNARICRNYILMVYLFYNNIFGFLYILLDFFEYQCYNVHK